MHQIPNQAAVIGNRDRLSLRYAGQRPGHRVRMRGGVNIALGQGGMWNGHRRFAARAEAKLRRANQNRHIAVRMLVIVHELMSDWQFGIRERLSLIHI